jgi:hypothetical protein
VYFILQLLVNTLLLQQSKNIRTNGTMLNELVDFSNCKENTVICNGWVLMTTCYKYLNFNIFLLFTKSALCSSQHL